MSEQNQRPDEPDILERAIDAVRSRPIPVGLPADVLASTAEAIQNRLNTLRSPATPLKRTRRFLRYGSFATAAAILVCVVVGLIWLNNGTARAFEQALEKLRSTEAVRYRVHMKSESSGPMDKVTIQSDHLDEVTIRGKQMRVEVVGFPKLTWIIDSGISGMLILDPQRKTYQTVDLAANSGGIAPFDMMAVNMRAQLDYLIKRNPVYEKRETVEGIAADRYSINGGESLGLKGDWSVWLDRMSSYPVRIVFESKQEGKSLSREYSQFEWNPTIAEDAFGLDPPGDFREDTIIRTIPPLVPLLKKK